MELLDKEDKVIAMVINGKELGYVLGQLNELKQSKVHVHIDLDLDNEKQLLIHHEEDGFLK